MAVVAALLLALVSGGRSAVCHGITDNILCVPLPHGWHGSVGFGGPRSQPSAWIVAGNFKLAGREGGSPVPPHRTKIVIGDFPATGVGWRKVRRLRLPVRLPAQHTVQMGASYWSVTRRVRYARRDIIVTAVFGSRPDPRLRALANARLAAVHRLGR